MEESLASMSTTNNSMTTTMTDRTNVGAAAARSEDVKKPMGSSSKSNVVLRQSSSSSSNINNNEDHHQKLTTENTAPSNNDDAIVTAAATEAVAAAAAAADENIFEAKESGEDNDADNLEDVELAESPFENEPADDTPPENKPLKKRNVISAMIFRRGATVEEKDDDISPTEEDAVVTTTADTPSHEPQQDEDERVKRNNVISAIFRRGSTGSTANNDNTGEADEIAHAGDGGDSLAEDSQMDSVAEEAAVKETIQEEEKSEGGGKGNFLSNMIQRARSQTIDDPTDVAVAEITEVEKAEDVYTGDTEPALEEKAATGNMISSFFRRGGKQTDKIPVDDHPPADATDANIDEVGEEASQEEESDPVPPPTPEEMPKSPGMDFEFTPLSPMYLAQKDDNKTSESEDKASIKIPMAMQTPPFQRAQPQSADIAAASSSSPSLPSPAPPSPVIVTKIQVDNATDEELPEAWAGLDDEYEQISASEPPGMTPRVGLPVEETNSMHSIENLESTETGIEEQHQQAEEDNGHDPPGFLPSWKDDIKELEESRTDEVDQMKEELDVIFNDIDESGDELKHHNPWMTTPVVKKMQRSGSKQPSPAGSDFQNMVSSATLGPTPDSTPVSTPMMAQQKTGGSVASGTVTPLRDQSPSRLSDCLNTSAFSDVDPFHETPVRSNLTYAQLDSQGEAAFVNGTPLSKMTGGVSSSAPSIASSDKDSDRYAPAVAIQSNTPRTRKILEWLDPSKRKKRNVSDTWPAPSMATKVRSTDTPDRQLPSRQLIPNDDTQHAQVRRVSDWWVPRPSHSQSNSSSPASLPSMLGHAPQNEVSDLESPNMNYPILNFKFSEEESTINSQSVQDQASEMHSNGGVSPSLRSMLNNTYSLHGAGTGLEPPTPHSVFSSYTAGCPTDEQCSPTARCKSAPGEGDIESNNQTIQQNPTAETVDSDGVLKANRGVPRISQWCRFCAVLLLFLAIAAAVAVPLCLKYLPLTSSNDGYSSVTDAPSVAILENAAPTGTPTTGFAFSPSIIPPDEDVGQSQPSIPGTSVTAAPTTTEENSEAFDNLSWNRIESGEGIWRGNAGNDTPVWYFSNPQDQDFSGLNGIDLQIINAADELYATHLRRATDDYNASDAVASLRLSTVPYQSLCQPENGKVKVCSGEFGNTDWYGSTALFMRGNSIVGAIIRLNKSKNGSPEILQHTICHQLGHVFGLQHSEQSSCLQDLVGAAVDETAISNQLQHPSQDDLDTLVTVYGAVDV